MQTGSWDIVQTRKCHADANANSDANRICTKNNMFPSPSVGDIKILPMKYNYKVLIYDSVASTHNSYWDDRTKKWQAGKGLLESWNE